MPALTKGQNGPLSTSDVVISVDLATAADISALLVTDRGVVRSDDDFVFYNQPTGPGVRLETVPGGPARLHVSTGRIPADIDAVRAVITLDDASSTFGRFAPPVARVSDTTGRELYEFTVAGLSSESVVIALEVYRRNGDWKVRAVGQGYAGGFADLVRDHGVSVDDEPQAPAATVQPTPPAYSKPQAPTPPAPTPAPTPRPTPVPASAPTAAPTPRATEINLSKDRPVSLTKGQKVTLRKEGGVALTNIQMGLGWDPVRGGFGRGGSIDLDASVLMYSGGKCVETVYYGHLNSKDRSVLHSGDNLTGEGAGDDEVIRVALQSVPPHIDALMFIVTSYRGHTFEKIENAYCRLVDETTSAELARYTLKGGMPFTAVAMAVISRDGATWKLRAIGDGFNAKTPKKAQPHVTQYL
ncbi:TerD family protein [Gordonia sp. zg691]|uniref:TerD family protein n=1 Tax=Gordonia jinghuaiqii TaxID=2758710 RepID=A0A7D7QZL3_9ACTN|nr:TerD family protein [Gordonia jinghuaiqii]MBD0862100.1 TerD family protein [Gordonia jinghuaiqii]MCR5978674.1 stress protein [Gordonia jinghuaiqii]QMT02989.1 TerD family protein [Gordonia jinghuaiqii]